MSATASDATTPTGRLMPIAHNRAVTTNITSVATHTKSVDQRANSGDKCRAMSLA